MPLVTAPLIVFDGWSPDSQTFAFWTFTDQQSFDFSYPPGLINFWQENSNQICSYPYSAEYLPNQGNLVAWLPDGEALILTSDPPRIGMPCANDFTPVSELPAVEEVTRVPSLSPNGLYRARTTILDDAAFLSELVATSTLWPTTNLTQVPGATEELFSLRGDSFSPAISSNPVAAWGGGFLALDNQAPSIRMLVLETLLLNCLLPLALSGLGLYLLPRLLCQTVRLVMLAPLVTQASRGFPITAGTLPPDAR